MHVDCSSGHESEECCQEGGGLGAGVRVPEDEGPQQRQREEGPEPAKTQQQGRLCPQSSRQVLQKSMLRELFPARCCISDCGGRRSARRLAAGVFVLNDGGQSRCPCGRCHIA